MPLFWNQLFADRAWLKLLFEIVLLIFAAGVLRSVARRWLRRWMENADNRFRHSLAMLDRAVTPILLLSVIAVSFHLFSISAKTAGAINRVVFVAVLAVILYYASKLALISVNRWLEASPGRQSVREPVQFVTKVIFAVFSTMIVLENLGIRLTAVWTTLGVGSVAVALALQDTISNFFAGIYLRLDRPIRTDDYIKLDSGQEGFVIHLGWRSTRIRTLQNNIVVVPNNKLASSIVTNYALPESPMSLTIPIRTSYSSDPDHVEQILVEEAAQAAKEIPGLMSDPAPFVRFIPGFGDFALEFTLICRVESFTDQYLVQHELRKRILNRFRKDRIEIPSPERDTPVHVFRV